MAKVLIWGLEDFAELAHFYLTHDSDHEVSAFCVDREFLNGTSRYRHLPVVAFEDVSGSYPPGEYSFLAPMSHRRMNNDRKQVFHRIQDKGYELISYVSSKATVFPETTIGRNCFILEDNTIQPFVRIGDNVVLWSGNHLGHHSEIRDHVFFSSHVVLSGHCRVESRCFLGVNSTIRDGLCIAEGSLVGMGAVVTRDTEPWGVYTGSPARKGKIPSDELGK